MRQGGKTVYWTDDDKAILTNEWGAGTPTPEIAKTLERTPAAVSVMASRLRLPPRDKPAAARPAVNKRKCLSCRETFSPQWATSYVCQNCKSSPAWENPTVEMTVSKRREGT